MNQTLRKFLNGCVTMYMTSGPEVANFVSITRSSWQISIQGGKWEGLDNKRKQKQLTPVSKYYDQNRPFYSTWAYIKIVNTCK